MGGKAKPAKSTTNSVSTVDRTTENTPWGPATGAIENMVAAAEGAYAATPKVPIFTGPNADQGRAVAFLREQAANTAAGAPELRDLGIRTARGDYLAPESNPYLAGAISAAVDPYREQLGQNVLSIGDVSSASGAYGGDRSALLKARALTGFNRAAMNTSADMLADNYRFERGMQVNAGNILEQANDIMLKPGQVSSAIGDQQQSWEMARIAALQDAPWAGLDRYANIMGQVAPYATQHTTGTETTNSTTVGTPAKASGLSSAFGGALGGASAGSSFGPWGAAIGGVVGGLGGLFG